MDREYVFGSENRRRRTTLSAHRKTQGIRPDQGEGADCMSADNRAAASSIKPQHFLWRVEGKIAIITLSRSEKKNPLTFDSYGELVDTFRRLQHLPEIKCVVITGAGENFCSGGDVHEIIGPLVEWRAKGNDDKLLAFTRMTGSLVKAMRACPQPIVAA